MTIHSLARRRKQLREQLTQLEITPESLPQEVLTRGGGEVDGNMYDSQAQRAGREPNAPDSGDSACESPEQIRDEALKALRRIDAGSYGMCERCRRDIIDERLDLIPYARYCSACAAKMTHRSAKPNFGRRQTWSDTIGSLEGQRQQCKRHPDNGDQTVFSHLPSSTPESSDDPAAGISGDASFVNKSATMEGEEWII